MEYIRRLNNRAKLNINSLNLLILTNKPSTHQARKRVISIINRQLFVTLYKGIHNLTQNTHMN